MSTYTDRPGNKSDITFTRLVKRLRHHGLIEIEVDDPSKVRDLPEWSFARLPRRSVDMANRIFPRDLGIRFGRACPLTSVKVFGTESGETTSAVYRSIAYAALTTEPYLQVLVGYDPRQLTWRRHLQEELKLSAPTGIRTADEVLEAIEMEVV
ncbi:hypothetical protein [Shimia aestuarii]|uniref:Uncharacterized protein n=1 Tax=Shimia aestuarii TaxID=254406 RepID=A0A1I4NM94_9RHOB|nr:hypothetical protein [Shimia aestuarii]SFM16654.1 hypothetical protein SAMN04488042_104268 [Shimia aestuarii]